MCVCVCSSDAAVLEETLLAIAVVLSRASDLSEWDVFKDLFTFLSMLLDTKMSAEAGQ